MSHILIAGCGYVGRELARRLAGAGHYVWGLSRTPRGLPPGVIPVAADLADADALQRALPARLDQVVYAASAGGYDERLYQRAYIDGPRTLLEVLVRRRAPVGRVVYVSSTGVYPQSDGAWVDEETPCAPTTFSGRLVLEGERVVAGGPFPATVLRLGGIYGPGRTSLVEGVRSGAARRHRGAAPYTNRIHRDDAAGAIAHLLGLPDAAPCYVGVDRDPADENTVLEWLAAALGLPTPPLAEPGETVRSLQRSNKRCRSERLVASGYAFRYPTFREGYRALIEGAGVAGPADDEG